MTGDKVAILGCGPSAAYAYFGCLDAGIDPFRIDVIGESFSKPQGAFWLRESPIPWPEIQITLSLIGESRIYALKQWEKFVPTSADRYFPEGRDQFAMEAGYDPTILLPTLYSMLPSRLGIKLDHERVQQYFEDYMAVILTFPLVRSSSYVQIPIVHLPEAMGSFHCVYNGKMETPWIRQTTTPSGTYIEYPTKYSAWEMKELLREEEFRWATKASLKFVPDLPQGTHPLTDGMRSPVKNCLLVGRLATRNSDSLSHEARHEVARFLIKRKLR